MPFLMCREHQLPPLQIDVCSKNNGLECQLNFAVPPYIIRRLARLQILCYTNISLVLANGDFVPSRFLCTGETVPCLRKLITMEITVGALLFNMGPHIRRLTGKCHFLGLARPANRQNRLRYSVG